MSTMKILKTLFINLVCTSVCYYASSTFEYSFSVGQKVLMRDDGETLWFDGIVQSTNPLKVSFVSDVANRALAWDEVKPREVDTTDCVYGSDLVDEINADGRRTGNKAHDMDLTGMLAAMKAVGYKDNRKETENTLIAFFEDSLMSGNKVVARGKMYENSFSIQACYNSFASDSSSSFGRMGALDKLIATNKWNANMKHSNAFVDIDDKFTPCIESDMQLTQYPKANMQLAYEFLATFEISAQTFHAKLVEAGLNSDL